MKVTRPGEGTDFLGKNLTSVSNKILKVSKAIKDASMLHNERLMVILQLLKNITRIHQCEGGI